MTSHVEGCPLARPELLNLDETFTAECWCDEIRADDAIDSGPVEAAPEGATPTGPTKVLPGWEWLR